MRRRPLVSSTHQPATFALALIGLSGAAVRAQREAPGTGIPRASTTARPFAEVSGGCAAQRTT